MHNKNISAHIFVIKNELNRLKRAHSNAIVWIFNRVYLVQLTLTR